MRVGDLEVEAITVAGKARAHHLRVVGRDRPLCGYEPVGRYGWRTHGDVTLDRFRGFGGWWALCEGCTRRAERLGGVRP